MLNSTEPQDDFSKQVPKNLITNVLYFIVNLASGLFLVPYFIDSLGVASYAMIPLATSFTAYVNLIMVSLNTSVSRPMTIELQRGEFKKANVTFNTALFGTLGIILLMLPIVVLLSYYSPSFFDVPSNQENSTRILFLGVIIAFLLRAWSSNLGVSIFAYNRLDLLNIISAINILVQVGLIILFFKLDSPNLAYIGLAYLIAAIVAFVLTLFFSHKISPQLTINIKDFCRIKANEIMGMGGWVIITQIGSLLFLQIDLIVVNKLFGTLAGGEYSIAFMWSSVLRTIAGVLISILTPVILTYYIKGRIEELINLSKSAIKLTGFALALPVGFICGFAPQLLLLWIGPEFVKLSPLMLIMLSHLVINLPVMLLFDINVAYNKVRTPGIVTFWMGVGNFLLEIILPFITGWGYYGVAVAGAIVLTLKNAFFIPWYATKVLGIPKTTFMSSMIPGALAVFIVTGLCRLISFLVPVSGLGTLIISGIVITIAYICGVWIFTKENAERQIILSMIPSAIRYKFKLEIKNSTK
ncbi:polysaccharide biosynthesis protein [Methanosarcina sp. MSH10X1]|uniref:lipopolysaccharide biosynthesis protein n=1 Tax=Methanosarcina sp. MSH10X1 TaxID=2507075 RepID=UPI000FFC6B0C|nr:polysaccharide biosynthesis protein [Methanosarcina sp. MSH10X1]RXA19409.1 polysaccharide biosynthesis protein [Methanosarcina sp. MSH10X1]